MASRLFQTVIYQMQSALNGKRAGVIDAAGVVISCTDVNLIGENYENQLSNARDTGDVVAGEKFCFKRIGSRSRAEHVAFCEGTDEITQMLVGILCVALSQIKQFYDEKYDKISFVKNILIDNIMSGDVYIKAKALHLNTDVFRVAFLIHTKNDEFTAHEVVSGIFPDKNKDFVISISETDVVLIKEVKEDVAQKELDKIALSIVDTLGSELMTNVKIGIGSVVSNITEINRSYKDACVALEVGKVFDNELAIISYNNLGIGRLIYQLPTKLCELFLKEVFKKGSLDLLDDETIITIQKFFENNLNVSEASRQLFVHRNTLVYRLDKIHKITGLDLRKFDDAIVFKVAMMVNRYLGSDNLNI